MLKTLDRLTSLECAGREIQATIELNEKLIAEKNNKNLDKVDGVELDLLLANRDDSHLNKEYEYWYQTWKASETKLLQQIKKTERCREKVQFYGELRNELYKEVGQKGQRRVS